MSKNLDETVRSPVREKTRVDSRDKRGERLQGIAKGKSSALHLANSSAASLLGRNECPGTHCNLIVKEEREDSFRQRDEGKRKDGGED